jgi:hypothetical protein
MLNIYNDGFPIKAYSTPFGSKLYGTQTPTSDTDIKHIIFPSYKDLLLNKKLVNIVKKTNHQECVRNSVDDIDEEFIPIQIFARDFLKGQTYALEIAFAYFSDTNWPKDYDTFDFYNFMYELRQKFLTSNINAMVGYVTNQANIYSNKGERLNLIREIIDMLKGYENLHHGSTLGDIYQLHKESFEALKEKYPKYFEVTTYNINGNYGAPVFRDCIKIFGKVYAFDTEIPHLIGLLKKVEGTYGKRADSASIDNVDWKAMMHAIRISDEAIWLMDNNIQNIQFPYQPEYVKELLSIKHGERSIEDVRDMLDDKLELLRALEKTSTLPKLTPELETKFEAWFFEKLVVFYQ